MLINVKVSESINAEQILDQMMSFVDNVVGNVCHFKKIPYAHIYCSCYHGVRREEVPRPPSCLPPPWKPLSQQWHLSRCWWAASRKPKSQSPDRVGEATLPTYIAISIPGISRKPSCYNSTSTNHHQPNNVHLGTSLVRGTMGNKLCTLTAREAIGKKQLSSSGTFPGTFPLGSRD